MINSFKSLSKLTLVSLLQCYQLMKNFLLWQVIEEDEAGNEHFRASFSKCALLLMFRRLTFPGGLPGGTSGKEPSCQCWKHKRLGFDPCVRKLSWRSTGQPTPVFLPGESHGQRSLVGYSPWGRKDLDTTEVTQHACMQAFKNKRLELHFGTSLKKKKGQQKKKKKKK